MGASEDRATLAEQEFQRRASDAQEIMVPGHGIWTKIGLKVVLDERRERREADEARALHDQEPGRWGDHASPQRMRREVLRDREEERYG